MPISPLAKRISSHMNIRKEVLIEWYFIQPNIEDLLSRYSGRLFFKECMLMSRDITKNKLKTTVLIVLCTIHALLPFFIELTSKLLY